MADNERACSSSSASTSGRDPEPPRASRAAGEEYVQQKYGSSNSHVTLTHSQVEGMLDQVLESSATVQYLLESLKMAGCGVGRSFFHVTTCNSQVGGGFSTDHGVILCSNRLAAYQQVELAVAHELIHAYDYCRAGNLDLRDCRHHACTEIRAANLSGDCSFWQEALRGNLGAGLVGQHRRCVERRALLSVGLNPYCQGGKAEAAVAEMLPRCLKDTDPFPHAPGLR